MGTGVEVLANLRRSARLCGGRGDDSRGDDGADDSHDAVEADGDAVAGAAMGCWQDFRGVGVEAAVVDVLRRNC